MNLKECVVIPHALLKVKEIKGKKFTLDMVYLYCLILQSGNNIRVTMTELGDRIGVTRITMMRLLNDLIAMGLFIKSPQYKGGPLMYTALPLDPEMITR
ncbi:helix-turn-helix domain-containing protein [Pseudescherichia vulneris]|uniref:helix-turn-helix domain-containing protein n=1 Tax=Pseudescherichia vulneris TaxID=566 RepID=UPI0028D3762B|nr:helix-turn-helix domain-containing protein [Pseudescherichia vulneris]